MLFKDDLNFTSNERERDIEFNGSGHFNGGTGNHYTNFYIESDRNFLNKSLDYLISAITKPKFIKKEFLNEKKIIINEILTTEDVFDDFRLYFNQQIYQDHYPTFLHLISGKIKDIKKLRFEKLVNYYKTHFSNKNLIVVITGNIKMNYNEIVKKIENIHFNEDTFRKDLIDIPTKNIYLDQKHSNCIMKDHRSTKYTLYFTNMYKDLKNHNKDQKFLYALYLFSQIYGMRGLTNSLLNMEIREKRKLVYSISAIDYTKNICNPWITAMCNTGSFENVLKIIDSILSIQNKLLKNGIDNETLEKFKEYEIRDVEYAETNQFDSFNFLFSTSQNYSFKNIDSPKKYIKIIKSIDKSYFDKYIIRDLFENTSPILTLLSPIDYEIPKNIKSEDSKKNFLDSFIQKQFDEIEKIYNKYKFLKK